MLPRDVIDLARRLPDHLMTNRQIMALGHSSWDLTRWTREGLLTRPIRGLYHLPEGLAPEWAALHVANRYLLRRHRDCAARRAPGPHHVLSGPAAVRALGAHELADDSVVALIDPGRRVRVAAAPFTVRRTPVRSEQYLRRRGLPLATPARALADLAEGDIDDLPLRAAVDQLRWQGMPMVPAAKLWRAGEGAGFARLHRMVIDGVFEQESEGERLFFDLVLRRLGSLPDCQVWVTPRRRVDFVFLDAGLIIEYHGISAHRDQVDEDAVRHLELLKLGYDLLVVTKGMVRAPDLPDLIAQRRRQGVADLEAGRRRRPPAPILRPRLTRLRTLPEGMSAVTSNSTSPHHCD